MSFHVPGGGSPLFAPHGRGAFARLRLGILPDYSVSLRQISDDGRELSYRLNALATPVVKRCWAHPLQVNGQSPVRAFEIAMPPSTNHTRSQFHPPCAKVAHSCRVLGRQLSVSEVD